jgi:hypothetical protein
MFAYIEKHLIFILFIGPETWWGSTRRGRRTTDPAPTPRARHLRRRTKATQQGEAAHPRAASFKEDLEVIQRFIF